MANRISSIFETDYLSLTCEDDPSSKSNHYVVSATKIQSTELIDKKTKFRSRFKLTEKDQPYIHSKGIDTIRFYAIDFITSSLAAWHLGTGTSVCVSEKY